MKAKLFVVILTLALATLAQAAVVPSTPPTPTEPTPAGPASSPEACANWCRYVLCTSGKICGYYVVAGTPGCGCHDPSVLPGSQPPIIN